MDEVGRTAKRESQHRLSDGKTSDSRPRCGGMRLEAARRESRRIIRHLGKLNYFATSPYEAARTLGVPEPLS
jgi:hypothetical protein